MKKMPEWITRIRLKQKGVFGRGHIFLFMPFILLCSCFSKSHKEDFDRAQELSKQENYIEALALYEKVFIYSSDENLVFESAKRAADLCETKTKNHVKAVQYLKFVIANSKDFTQSFAALYKKAFIEHKLLSYFEDAIQSYQRLLSFSDISSTDTAEIRLNIAKCFYAIHDYTSARNELFALLSPTQKPEIRFRAKSLQASLFQTEGHLEEAIKSYQEALVIEVAEKEKTEGLISLALCYEQKEDYKKALETMQKIQTKDDFLKIKINQLERLVQFQGRRLNR